MTISPRVRDFFALVVLFGGIVRIGVSQHWALISTVGIYVLVAVICLTLRYGLKKRSAAFISRHRATARPGVGAFSLVFLGAMSCVPLYLGVSAAEIGVQQMKLQKAELTWPSIQGTIISGKLLSRTDRRGTISWFPSWSYSYVVQPKSYVAQSTTIARGYEEHQYSVLQRAKEAVAARPDNASVSVFYDPEDPQRSVLDRLPAGDNGWLFLLISLVLFAAAAALSTMVVLAYRRNFRTKVAASDAREI
jgi:hypothetical protein